MAGLSVRQFWVDKMTKLLEICVDTPDALDIAISAGADRIELCSALDLGGLTPSIGLMIYAAQKTIPVYAMIRPRTGSFCFNQADKAVMLSEIAAVAELGLTGVVLGASNSDGTLDMALLQELCAYAEKLGLGTTLHRAFDLVPDAFVALEQAIELKFERILTAGLQLKAIDGAEMLAALNRQAAGRIIIMPGSGITSDNAVQILETVKTDEIHASGRESVLNHDQRSVDFGFSSSMTGQTSADKISALKQAISGL